MVDTEKGIRNEFDAAEIPTRDDFEPSSGSQRRSMVNEYLKALDLDNPSDVAKLLKVYETVIEDTFEAEKLAFSLSKHGKHTAITRANDMFVEA